MKPSRVCVDPQRNVIDDKKIPGKISLFIRNKMESGTVSTNFKNYLMKWKVKYSNFKNYGMNSEVEHTR